MGTLGYKSRELLTPNLHPMGERSGARSRFSRTTQRPSLSLLGTFKSILTIHFPIRRSLSPNLQLPQVLALYSCTER